MKKTVPELLNENTTQELWNCGAVQLYPKEVSAHAADFEQILSGYYAEIGFESQCEPPKARTNISAVHIIHCIKTQ
jgi:hypothetical protein